MQQQSDKAQPVEELAAPGGTEPPAPPPGPEETVEVMPSTEELLRKAELAAAEHHDAWLRAKAETENVRRRAQDDVARAQKYAVDGICEALLPVRDSLEASLAADNASVEQIRTGVELTLRQLSSVFEKFAIQEINPVGEKFDPHRHQAMCMVESAAEAGSVVSVMQKGYQLHDRVVRPALVTVAKARDA